MNEQTWNRVKQIFHEAVARPAVERPAFLAEACADDSLVRSEVEELLAASDDVDEQPIGDATREAERTHEVERAGATIGRYKLLQQIGEGGFGVVYMAEQEEPVRRRVALKIIKLGMDTKEVIARFEAERQALAILDHPNIGKVFDGGATDTGRPYFVMELVKGVPITEYCDQNNLTTGKRLQLFVEVCHAVHHAHQKGIIHRDIKPTNVMVTLHDGNPVPKIIDFGIAKATHHRLTEKTLFTAYGQFIGTPTYMSPEQAEMSGLDIDTRSDVYSLGVLLYELLTGTTPFDGESLRTAAYAEIQRILKEVEPPKPSTRLTTLGEALNAIATHRQTDPGALARLMRGDLDWIVMKALEKDRTRRYGSASDLAADIARHFDSEPVVARPASRSYRLRKFVTRHRGPVAAATAIGTTIVVLGSLAMWLGWSAQQTAEQMRATSVVAFAAAAEDPLLKAQLLLEIADRPDTPGLLSVAREAANFPLPIAVFKGHERSLVSVAFDPDGTHIVTSSRDGTLRVWRIDGSTEPVVLRGYPFGLDNATFSPDGRLVGAGSNGGVYIWRADGTGGPVILKSEFRCRGGCGFAFRHDSSHVVVISAGSAMVWRTDGKGEPVVLPAPDGALVRRVAFSPDGSLVATGLDDGTVKVWSQDGAGEPTVLRGLVDDVTAVAFSPDGSQLLAGSEDGTVRVWHVGSTNESIVLLHEAGVRNAIWGPGGETIMTVTRENTARMWRLDEIDEPPTVHEALHIAINPDVWLGATAHRNTARIWKVRSEFVELRGHEQEVRDLAFSPDGSLLATIGENTARLWRVDDTGESVDLEGPGAVVTSAALSPDGVRVVTGLEDGTVHVRRVDGSGEPLVLQGHEGRVESVAFSGDGTRIVTRSRDGSARLWRADGTGESRVFTEVRNVAIDPEGRRVATANGGPTVQVWSTGAAEEPLVLQVPRLAPYEFEIGKVTFSPDGSQLAASAKSRQDEAERTAGSEALALVWRLDGSGDPVVFRGHQHAVDDLFFSPDGSRLLTISTDGTARVWPVDGEGDPVVFEGHLDEVLRASFSPDGSLVVSASTDASARIWRADDGEELAVLRGHDRWVTGADFSPDGARVATASTWDLTARVWRIDGTDKPLVMRWHELRERFSPWPMILASFSEDGSRVLTVGVGTARIWRVSWPGLRDYLREHVRVCLTSEERTWYLAESPLQARAAFDACERRLGI